MNIPVNPDGSVSFYTTLLSIIRVSLHIFSKGTNLENDEDLRKIIKCLWPDFPAKSLERFFPKLTGIQLIFEPCLYSNHKVIKKKVK